MIAYVIIHISTLGIVFNAKSMSFATYNTNNGMFEFQCLLKHNHFITKFGLHQANLEFL
jgi:hypothetical protein